MKKLFFMFLILLTTNVQAEHSILVYSSSADKIIHQQNIYQTRPLASITKLMTAMVTLDFDKDLSKKLLLNTRVGSNLPRQQYTRYQLLNAMLVRSDNAAAETLAEDYPGGRKAFIQAMNDMAATYGMLNTRFDDPTGLSNLNISTAIDIALMVEAASNYWVIRDASIKKQIVVETQTKRRTQNVHLNNTNSPILFEFQDIVVSKTGFTSRAGWCLAMAIEKDRHKYVVVILGAPNKKERVKTAERLMHKHVNDPSKLFNDEDYWRVSYRYSKFIPSSPSW